LKLWPSNILLRHTLIVPVLLVSVILAVYYPAMLSGVHPVDDPGIIGYFSSSPPLSKILLPGNSFYYRPIVELSYYVDNWLWGMEPLTMHLEGILLHCANSVLVYLLARRILLRQENQTSLLPLCASLLFALHPVNVEAVAWIAGRTDPLLALSVLSACLFWLRWLDNPRWPNMVATMLLFCVALLTKETALAFSAVVVLLALTWPGAATGRQRLRAVAVMSAPGILLVMFALVFKSGTSALSRFISATDFQAVQGSWESLIALGFYVRKLIVPFPLNAAIFSVHPLYGVLGGAILPLLWLVFRRNRLSGVMFISAALFIMPAILVAMNQIAWTPFAERYLYLPTAFFALGLAGIGESWNRKHTVALLSCIVLVLCGFGLGIFQRNLLWKDSLAFFRDAVAKSPNFGSVYFSLGVELIKKGEIDQAAAAFTTAERLNQRESMRYPIKAGIMGTMYAKGEYLEARKYFFQTFKSKQDAPADFLDQLRIADSKRLETMEKKDKIALGRDLLETLDLLNKKKPDPFWLYRSGQISQVIGDNATAADFFRRSFSAAPINAHYRPAAQIYLKKLEHGK
jgi:protein O-mannosyl-transferase